MQGTLFELFFSFFRLGLTAFGGPAMVVYIRELAVKKKLWLDQETFNEGVSLAQIVPGPIAMHIAGFVGLKVRGVIGAMVSYTAFALPAFLLMLLLSYLYQKTANIPQVASLFAGLKVIVVAIVANAFLIFTKSILKSKAEILIALGSSLLLLGGINPFIVLILCFLTSQTLLKDYHLPCSRMSNKQNLNLASIFLFLFIILFGLICLYFFNKKLFQLSFVMLKINLFAFGGAYTALPLMFHEVVENMSLLDSKTFMNGIALGQITPGPILITATFVGYLVYGYLGALFSTFYVFSPSFFVYLLCTRLADRVRSNPVFLRGKRGLIASFSALLLYATFKFGATVDWSLIKIVLFGGYLFALYRGINVLYVVAFGSLISILLSS